MKRELGIVRCGLACCLCTETPDCDGCGSNGFLDINLLLPLAEALEVSVLELMHSERQKEKVQLFQDDTIIVHLMENAVEMNKQNKQQDRSLHVFRVSQCFLLHFL